MALINQRLDDVPEGLGNLIPNGWYQAHLTRAELKNSKGGDPMIELEWIIMVGQMAGRRVYEVAMLAGSGVDMGRQRLKRIATAIGLPNPNYINDTDELLQRPCRIKVGVKKDKDGIYDDKNNVMGYDYVNPRGRDGQAAPVQGYQQGPPVQTWGPAPPQSVPVYQAPPGSIQPCHPSQTPAPQAPQPAPQTSPQVASPPQAPPAPPVQYQQPPAQPQVQYQAPPPAPGPAYNQQPAPQAAPPQAGGPPVQPPTQPAAPPQAPQPQAPAQAPPQTAQADQRTPPPQGRSPFVGGAPAGQAPAPEPATPPSLAQDGTLPF
jgi:hypothetical protein